MFAPAFRGLHRFEPDRLLIASADELWLGLVGALVISWLALATLAPGKAPDAAANCDFHGRAALMCREQAPASGPPDSNCPSFGRGGRVCFNRP